MAPKLKHIVALIRVLSGRQSPPADAPPVSAQPQPTIPDSDIGWSLLGRDQWEAAETVFRDRLAAGSRVASDSYGLGRALMFRGQFTEAEVFFARAHALAPHWIDLRADLGSMLWIHGWYEAARDVLAPIAEEADNADIWHYLGMSWHCLDDPKAVQALSQAQRRAPIAERFWCQELFSQALAYLELPEAPRDRATDLRRLEAMVRVGRLVGAERLAATLAPFGAGEERARNCVDVLRFLRGYPIACVPASAQVFILQVVDLWRLLTKERWIDAPHITGLLLKIVTGEQPAHSILAGLAQRYAIVGAHDRAIACFRDYAKWAQPGDVQALGWLTSILAGESTKCENVLERVQEANRFLFPGSDQINKFPALRHRHDGRIRVGYNCSYFGTTASRTNYSDILSAHDRSAFEIVAFNTGPSSNETRQFFAPFVDRWVECGGLDAADVERTFLEADLDILNDFDGVGSHMGSVLARKLAPIQVNMTNWAMTTGLPAYDYYIVGPGVVTPDDERTMSERVKVLPAEDPWRVREAPPPSAPPALQVGYVTFGCFGASHKVTPKSLDLWADVLREVPFSKLMLKSRFAATHEGRDYYRRAFAGLGISPHRIILDGVVDYALALQSYDRLDIALDTFPHSGGASGWDPLWQGVPLVTLDLGRFCSRWGTVYVNMFGYPEWSAKSETEFVDIAVSLASDIGRLAAWRRELRNRVAPSKQPRVRTVRALEQIYREIVEERLVAPPG